MSNNIAPVRYSTLIELTLEPRQDWAVGAFTGLTADAEGAENVQRLPVVRAADGSVYLPATSLAGSLREHLGAAAVKWLGGLSDKSTTASALRLLSVSLSPELKVDSRASTAICPKRRAAEVHTLREAQYVAAGGKITWRMVWDRATEQPQELGDLLLRLASWHPVIGRSRSTGKGQAELTGLRHWTCDRQDSEQLGWWLTQRGQYLAGEETPEPPNGWMVERVSKLATPVPVLEASFEVVDALHLGGAQGSKPNELGTYQKVAGESWKGVFRHRVTHILQVTGRNLKTVDKLFGASRAEASRADGSGGRGCLRFVASPVTPAVGVDGKAGVQRITQVGIDRVTGGALMNTKEDPTSSAGSLFTVQYLPPGSSLELKIYSTEELCTEELQLLRLVVRDVNDGIIGIGGMTTRGFGTIKEKVTS